MCTNLSVTNINDFSESNVCPRILDPIKIGSVTVLIWLPWTNFIRTNVAWTMSPGHMASDDKDGPKNLPLKFGQSWETNL